MYSSAVRTVCGWPGASRRRRRTGIRGTSAPRRPRWAPPGCGRGAGTMRELRARVLQSVRCAALSPEKPSTRVSCAPPAISSSSKPPSSVFFEATGSIAPGGRVHVAGERRLGQRVRRDVARGTAAGSREGFRRSSPKKYRLTATCIARSRGTGSRLDAGLQRHGAVVRDGGLAVRGVVRQGRRPQQRPRVHRRPGVLSEEFAELPLPRQEPERVAHLGAERPLEVHRPGPSLEPVPALDDRNEPRRIHEDGGGER